MGFPLDMIHTDSLTSMATEAPRRKAFRIYKFALALPLLRRLHSLLNATPWQRSCAS